MEIGCPPLRSIRTKGSTDKPFDQEYITKAVQDQLLHRIGELAFQVNFLHVQLVHDYKAPSITPSD